MSPGLRLLTSGVLLHRAHYEAAELLIPPVSDHVPWAYVSEQWVHGLEPKCRLRDVASEELRYEAADVRDLFQAIEHFIWNLLIKAHRRGGNACQLRHVPLVQ